MPTTVEHPKTAQMNFRLDPEVKKQGDAALAAAGYRHYAGKGVLLSIGLWEVAASGRYRPELIRAFLSGTIAIEYDSSLRTETEEEKPFVPTEEAQNRLQLLRAGRDREQVFFQKLGLAGKTSVQSDPSKADSLDDISDDYDDELAEALAEAYEEKAKNFAPMTPQEVEEQLRKLGGWQHDREIA